MAVIVAEPPTSSAPRRPVCARRGFPSWLRRACPVWSAARRGRRVRHSRRRHRRARVRAAHEAPSSAEGGVEEPIPVEGDTAAALDTRMGEWIIAACRHKKLAFALAFPFVRRPLSVDAVNATRAAKRRRGPFLPIIPGADMPIMTLNQAKMLLQIAAAYGQPMSTERVKELACVVGGAFALRNLARSVAGAVPVLGWAVRAGVGYAGNRGHGARGHRVLRGRRRHRRLRDRCSEGARRGGRGRRNRRRDPVGRKVLVGAKSAAGEVIRRVRSRS